MARPKTVLTPSTGATGTLSLSPGPTSIDVSDILLRKNQDTRTLNAAHIVMLAESISVLGLLEPIVVDTKGRLLAGAHRLAAVQLLAIDDELMRENDFLNRAGYNSKTADRDPTGEQTSLAQRVNNIDTKEFSDLYPKSKIPVIVVDVSGRDSKTVPLAIEAAENNVRRQYSPDDIKALAARYKEAGYVMSSGGRPKKGEKTVMNALEAALGCSKRKIQRILYPPKSKRSKSPWDKALASSNRILLHLIEAGAKKSGEQDNAIVSLAEKLAKAIEKLKGK
jgi:ParB-like chromosome segregation protein Spo0J